MAADRSGDRPAAARSNRTTDTHSRRSIAAGVVAALLPLTAGCSAITDFLGGNPGEVTVFNDTDSAVTATLTVTDVAAETTVLSETTDVDASGAATFDDVFETATEYRFAVETADGLTDSYEWNLPSTDHYLYATVHGDSIEFEENEP